MTATTEIWNRYVATEARSHDKPGRQFRPQSLTFDAHAHIAVAAAGAFLKPHLDMDTIPLARWQTPETRAVNDRQDEDVKVRLFDQEHRIRNLDAMGVDMQLVMPTPNQCCYAVSGEVGAEAARLVNDGLRDFVARRPDRFVAFGTVPMQDAELAVRELDRCVNELGFKGVQILTTLAGREVSDPSHEPFWKRAEELGATVFIHPNGFTEGARFQRFYFNNVIGNPLETTLALHHLIFDGVLERYPALKIVAAHGGGFVGGYWGRIDHAWGARSDCRGDLPNPPSSYLKKVYVDSVVFTPGQLENLVTLFGADHVLMGTDDPFDMGEYDPVGHIVGSKLDEAAVEAICGGNAKRLLNL